MSFDGFSFQLDAEGEVFAENEECKKLSFDDREDLQREYDEVIKTGVPKRVHKTYSGNFYAVFITPVYTEKNTIEGHVINGFPIPFTLFDNLVVNSIVDIAFYVSLKEGDLYLEGVNNAVEKLTGLKKSRILGKKVVDILPRTSILRVLEKNYESLHTGRTVHWEENIRFPVGQKYFEITVTPVCNERGFCGALIGTAHDVTARKMAEVETAKNYSIINAIIEGTSDAIFVKDREGRYKLCNSSGAELLGFSSYDMIQKRDIELFSEETASQFVTSDRVVLEDGIQRTTEEEVTINGKFHHFLSVKGVYRDQDGKVAGTFGISRDITKIKQIEKDLVHSNSLLKATLNATADGILVLDHNRKVTLYNDRFKELWRFSDDFILNTQYEVLLGKVLNQLINPEECLDRLEEIELDPLMRSYDILEFKDGRLFERYTIPQILNGELVGRVFSYRDIAERKNIQGQKDKHDAGSSRISESGH